MRCQIGKTFKGSVPAHCCVQDVAWPMDVLTCDLSTNKHKIILTLFRQVLLDILNINFIGTIRGYINIQGVFLTGTPPKSTKKLI